MSTDRPNSGVQNLRAMFENQEANAQRSSSPGGRSSAGGDGDRKVSKVRASFVSVDRPGDLASAGAGGEGSVVDGSEHGLDKQENGNNTNSSDTTGAAVQQSNETQGEDARSSQAPPAQATDPITQPAPAVEQQKSEDVLTDPNKKVQDHTEKTEQTPSSPAVNGPIMASTLPTKDIPAENPDKQTTGVEEEPGPLKPAEPTNTATSAAVQSTPKSVSKKPSRANVSGTAGAAASPATKQNKQDTPSKTLTPKSKPSLNFRQSKGPTSPALTKPEVPRSPARPTTSDSKASEKSSSSAKPVSRGGRSSLTAQTASSAAKNKPTAADSNKHASTDKSLPIRTKPRSPTRPVKLPSHLTAPTAASAAKSENSKPASKTGPIGKVSGTSSVRSSLGDLKSSTHSAKSGLGRSNSTATRPAPRASNTKPVVADEGFLARMTRPTASSASRAHEKTDTKPAPSKPVTTTLKPRATTDAKHKAAPKSDKAQDGPFAVKPPAILNGQAKAASQPNEPKESTPAATESPAKQDETTIDSSIAGIGTPGIDASTIR
ncbi:hypothetical protein KVT40_000246 [Elsinoe batatas]|uniref:Uncharacterized protein n=1 Tax=Elsinoe batatas TaxID=2601811 RepID=A0A8K0L705_9PEZI|nr:hypothetical protein KVT40_000246 [Elsinoe batatas]